MSRDVATGNGIDVITITPAGVEYVIEKEVKSIIK